jgi:pimeloyl-ACP methyl ester carboxylesterase
MKIVLVHGAYHGSWCWERLTPELRLLGHSVVAVDLPIGDPKAGANAYADAIESAIDTAPPDDGVGSGRDGNGSGPDGVEPPVIVAHSMSGLVAPIVAARRPLTGIIFVAAFLPKPGVSANDQRHSEPIDPPFAAPDQEWIDEGDDVWTVGPNTATQTFYHDLEPDLAAWACERLRPQAYGVMNEASPLTTWPDTRTAYVVCRDDHAINADWGRSAAAERLGVPAIEIDGGHSPFLSRPAELAGILDAVVGTAFAPKVEAAITSGAIAGGAAAPGP